MKVLFFRLFGLILLVVFTLSFFLLKNLFIRFFSATFLFIFLFIIFYYLYIFLSQKKRGQEFFTLGNGIIYPFKETTLEIDCKTIVPQFPGFFLLLKFSAFDKTVKIKEYQSTILTKDKNKIRFNIKFDRHGDFILKDFNLLIRDIFGFTEYCIKINFCHTINIQPYFLSEIEIPISASEGGDQIIQSIKKINSTDFFDNRKYYPGDDIRRINWKIFAHSNELHIRQEEKIPPKVGEIFLIFAPYSDNLFEYEYICSIFLSTVYFLLKNNYKIKARTNNDNFKTIDNEKDIFEVINDSYIENINISNLNSSIVFCSFYQLNKFVNIPKINESFFAVTFFNNDINRASFLKSLFFITGFDNTLKEFLNIQREINNNKIRKERLKEISYKINNADSKIEIFDTNKYI